MEALLDNWVASLETKDQQACADLQTEIAKTDFQDSAKVYAEFVRTATSLAVRFKDLFMLVIAIIPGIVEMSRNNGSGQNNETLAGLAILSRNFSGTRWASGDQEKDGEEGNSLQGARLLGCVDTLVSRDGSSPSRGAAETAEP